MEKKFNELKTRLIESNDLSAAAALLEWDQSTYMPSGGAPARARQMATLQRLAHEKFTAPEIGKLLDDLQSYGESLSYDSDEASLLRVTRRQYDQATKIPASLVSELSNHMAESYQAWTEARAANDFPRMQPYLEKTLDLARQVADCFPGYDHIADPLIDNSDYGMKAETVRAIFGQLREQLVPIAKAITAQEPADDSCLKQPYPVDDQLAFGREVAKAYGYDFERGREDLTHHPFTTGFSIGDIRITTRVYPNQLGNALFATMHEAGHGMYEQGINTVFEGTPLASGTSSGVHESQSRLWENVVGRSRGFWEGYYPKLQATFPNQLGAVSLDTFYRAINKVEPSLIRVEADEVTYNLHIMIRFDLELEMLEGKLAVRDLPEAWNARYTADLGVTPPNDTDGVLQDIHWHGIIIGGVFQGYTLGNILSAQYYETALKAHPEIPDQIKQGQFGTLHTWLKDNIYQHGSKFTAAELTERVTGGALTIEPYVNYLRAKYGELYEL